MNSAKYEGEPRKGFCSLCDAYRFTEGNTKRTVNVNETEISHYCTQFEQEICCSYRRHTTVDHN